MHLLKILGKFLLVTGILISCNYVPDRDWTSAVPGNTPFVIIPAEQTSIGSVLESPYIPFLDDITSSAIQLVSQVDSSASARAPVSVKAILLYPGAGNELETIWITTAPEDFTNRLKSGFYRNFTQNQYSFQGAIVHNLHIGDRILYATQLHDLLLLSESSLGIEDAIRTYLDQKPAADLSDSELAPGSIIMNTPSLDKWVEQLAKVIHRPSIMNAFAGTKPAALSFDTNSDDDNEKMVFSGTLPLADMPRSELVAAISDENGPIRLDRYVSSNAAAFGIFRLSPRLAPPPSVTDGSKLDSTLIRDKVLYSRFAKSLESEFALVTYSESGFLSTGEHLFIRVLSDRSTFQSELNSLVSKGLIERTGNSYFISSQVLAELIGSELSGFSDFYLNITGGVVVISKRKGLAEVVASDRNRRRVIYYEQSYMDIREDFPDEVSSLVVVNSEFNDFIAPYLSSETYVNAITSKYDYLTITTRLNPNEDNLAIALTTYTSDQSNVPYREQWLFPTDGVELTGKPVLADIGGSSRNEIIFATASGSVYALAADGTVVLQLDTGDDVPVGSPVVYDWYGTNQNVILIAAGDKIYGWNDTGTPLPKFPFQLNEPITTPLSINDIDRNGLPEALVATADRRLHALDGRGNNLDGWPMSTNAVIKSKPLVDYYQGSYTVIAFSENAIHAWSANGSSRSGFPKFANATLNGSPIIYENSIMGGAADGYLYSIGDDIPFSDSLNVYSTMSDSSGIGAVYVSNSSLTGTPSIHNLTISMGEDSYSGPVIVTMSSNGSVFMLNNEGKLLFTQSMGQPSAPAYSPIITDLTGNNQNDIIALANFGRLYAWQVQNGERIYSIPTSGIQHFTIDNIDGDRYKELIAQTREGLRCWTIYGVGD